MIKDNVGQLLSPGQGALITISVPGGEEIALHTMNPQLGILGGISILGTTGIVEPMSEEAFKNSLVVRVRQVKALRSRYFNFSSWQNRRKGCSRKIQSARGIDGSNE